ncbi:toxin glutamine deamidase domain-containing protein [Nocardia thraciensis]
MEELRRKLEGLLGTAADSADQQLTAGKAIDHSYRTQAEGWRAGVGRYTETDAAAARTIGDIDMPQGSRAVSAAAAPGRGVDVPLAEIRPAGVSRLIRNVQEPTRSEASAMRRAYEAQIAILSRMGDRPPTRAELRELLQLVNPTRSRSAGNCMECSWAVRDILARRAAVAGPSGAQKFIEPSTERFHGDSHTEIHAAIAEQLNRPGRNAIMSGNRYSDAFGHHYNVANIDNEIYYLDGQTGTLTAQNIVPDGDYYVVFPMPSHEV